VLLTDAGLLCMVVTRAGLMGSGCGMHGCELSLMFVDVYCRFMFGTSAHACNREEVNDV
jgi:hypothetical protein